MILSLSRFWPIKPIAPKSTIVLALAATLSATTPAQSALDPVTVGAISQGVSLITGFLRKPQPNITLKLAQANRELLVAINSKLDNFGEHLIDLHLAVANISEEVAKELYNERVYRFGLDVTSRGIALHDYIISYEADLEIWANTPTQLDAERFAYLDNLRNLEREVRIAANNIYAQPTAKNLDAITLAIAVHVHLSILTERNVRFGLGESALQNAATKYVGWMDEVLQDDPDTLKTWTDKGFAALASDADWQYLVRSFGLSIGHWSLPGDLPFAEITDQTFDLCLTRIGTRKIRTFSNENPAPRDFSHGRYNITEGPHRVDVFGRKLDFFLEDDTLKVRLLTNTLRDDGFSSCLMLNAPRDRTHSQLTLYTDIVLDV